MATKPPRRNRTMKIGDNLGQHSQQGRRPKPKRRLPKESEIKPTEVSKDAEDHYDDKICVLCCEEIDIIAKGSCDHVVCFRCSSRMRALCKETYCAVCRHELKKVLFTEQNVPFSTVVLQALPSEERYGIVFHNATIKKKYKELLLNICPLCEGKKSTFDELRRHVRREHEKQYCDICVKNLKIFPQEFRVYSRIELVAHRKTGDPDNRSYKGHPICNFCNERYFDNDELLLHLRKNHFWCHFCEKDGKQEYYCNYEDLRSHFRTEHFLCEERDCIHEKYTSVFRSDIDLQAHRLAMHGKKLTKMAAKQARQVNVDIDYGKRKTYREKVSTERQPKNRQDTEIHRQPVRDRVSEQNSVAAAVNEMSVENVNGATCSDPMSAGRNGLKDADTNTKSLNAAAPEFVPSEATAFENGQAASLAGVANGAAKMSKQWSHVIRYPVGQDYGAEFPSMTNGGARPKTSLHLQERSVEKVSTQSKKVPAQAGSLQSSISATLQEKKKMTKPPPGLSKDNAVPNKLPPGIEVKGNLSMTNSTVNASSIPPGLAENGGSGKPALRSRFEDKSLAGSVQDRNLALVGLIQSLLNKEDFDKFKNLSGSFRRSEIDGSSYYRFIQGIFGNNLDLVFGELVDLLPDREKQKQLMTLHDSFRKFPVLDGKKDLNSLQEGLFSNSRTENLKAQPTVAWTNEGTLSVIGSLSKEDITPVGQHEKIPFARSQSQSDSSTESQSKATKKKHHKDFLACDICGFPVSKKGLASHMVIHAEMDFPALPTFDLPQKPWAKRANVSGAWSKSA